MHQSLIVARMAPGSAPDIAKIFEESDRGELPHLIGVSRRSLFQFDDIYIHLVESERDPTPVITEMAGHPEFRAISERLSSYVTAYDPATWRSPKDAMANRFYRWERDGRS
ncbi:TcmI family type II polyketide cyclase [Streptomyces sp. NPDC057438]|uniref:TcmI family type II polyketide cyclase n=1 Tax=Streptomyces sp. NPDC057438 TaxID=3346133 RepID=UPI003696E6B1